MTDARTVFLFSYGTLQQANVQLQTFGRRLQGRADALPGYRREMVRITDPAVIAASGADHHPIVLASGDPADGLWILEIQIAHPTRPIGAFYEDLLFREPA